MGEGAARTLVASACVNATLPFSATSHRRSPAALCLAAASMPADRSTAGSQEWRVSALGKRTRGAKQQRSLSPVREVTPLALKRYSPRLMPVPTPISRTSPLARDSSSRRSAGKPERGRTRSQSTCERARRPPRLSLTRHDTHRRRRPRRRRSGRRRCQQTSRRLLYRGSAVRPSRRRSCLAPARLTPPRGWLCMWKPEERVTGPHVDWPLRRPLRRVCAEERCRRWPELLFVARPASPA
jgi:hypothetical protein